MMILKVEQSARVKRFTWIQWSMGQGTHTEAVLVTTYFFLFIPVYRTVKLVSTNM